jgi:hypothetical protein
VSDKISTAPSSVSWGNVPLAEYPWNMMHDIIVQKGGAFREIGAAFRKRGPALIILALLSSS